MLFKDEYEFLSNFYPAVVNMYGHNYPTVEHAYQAMKTDDEAVQEIIRNLEHAGQAKKYGQKLVAREGWQDMKVVAMRMLLRQKFNDFDLGMKLIEVEEEIIEHNWWHDNFWGHCLCEACGEIEHKNNLGKLLTEIKDKF